MPQDVIPTSVADFIALLARLAELAAKAFKERGIPFVITTGYVDGDLDARYPGVPRCEKPIDPRKLLAALSATLG